jgi:sulfonate transport system substrate-binding protein
MTFTARLLRTALFVALAFAPLSAPSVSAQELKELKIGFQKTGLPVIARQQGTIEKRLAARGIGTKWVEFTAGPPLLEALNVGSIDFGWTGDGPPIFAQAAGAKLVYVAALPPNGAGEAIIVKADSPIKSVADLKGKKVAMGKGTSAHNLTVAALEKAGLSFADINPVYLSPADAAAAFARDSVDAWTIWDPFLAIAETRAPTRTLTTGKDTFKVNTYALANRDFADKNPRAVLDVLDGLTEAAAWASANRDKVATSLAEITGVELTAQKLAAGRLEFGVFPVSEDIVTGQQATADRFQKLGLIPRAIIVRDIVWKRPQT